MEPNQTKIEKKRKTKNLTEIWDIDKTRKKS
jgi:hypothetical protein